MPTFANHPFSCEACSYSCLHRGDWNKHLNSSKHARLSQSVTESPSSATCVSSVETYTCLCGKTYAHPRSLKRHRRTCALLDKEQLITAVCRVAEENRSLAEKVKTLLPANQVTNTAVVNNNTINNNTVNSYGDYQPQYITAIKDSQINMQVFLDKHCGEAINLTTFIESLRLTNNDLDDTRERGLAYSLGKVILRGLRELDLSKRPIHCGNLRKSVMYIRDNDVWDMDRQETHLRSAIGILSSRQINQIKEWERDHPHWDKTEQGKHMYADMVHKVLVVARADQKEKIENSVIKTIAKETLIPDVA